MDRPFHRREDNPAAATTVVEAVAVVSLVFYGSF
jgi:hypothetical protein